MPPESLSTLAVMNPGPRTARNSSIRIRQRFHMPAGSYGGFIQVSFLTITGQAGAREPCRPRSREEVSRRGLTGLDYRGTLVRMYQGGAHAASAAKSRTCRSRARPDRRPYGKALVEGAQGRRRAEGDHPRRPVGRNRPARLRRQTRSLLRADAEGNRAVQVHLRHDSEGRRQPQPEGAQTRIAPLRPSPARERQL